MSALDPRKETILRAVIFEYVRHAEPVASESIASKYELGVKSATIRNVLADLADIGLLEQPHTSAGRVPSDAGYRYFVDRLMITQEPDASYRNQVKGAAADGEAVQELLTETTRALSRLTHLLSAATLVRNQNLIIRSAFVTAIGPKQALLVVAFSNGEVENRMLEVPAELTLPELGEFNNHLREHVTGKGMKSVTRQKPSMYGVNEALTSSVWSTLRMLNKEKSKVSVTTQGEEFLFGKPEFQRDAGFLAEALDDLKSSNRLAEVLHDSGQDLENKVTIGREHQLEQLHRLSVVRQSYFVGEDEAGVIAVVGPTRMAYNESIPLVSFAAKALSDALTKFFG